MDPKKIVREGYDQVSHAYRGDQEDEGSKKYHAWLDELLPLISGISQAEPRPAILDLGCGNGIPVARRLVKDYTVTGVDISPVQIERARELVPQATFLCQDMTTLEFSPSTFAAVLAFYSIIHLPIDKQPALLARIFTWLRPGGMLMGTLGSGAWTGTEDNWLNAGGTMYWSTARPDQYRAWLKFSGFTIRQERFIPEGDGGHTLFLAEKPLG